MSPAADTKALTQRVYDEAFNRGNVDVIDELMSDDFVEHEDFPGLPPGKEGVRQFTQAMLQAFPDLAVHVEDMIAENEKVVSRVRFVGTHQGEFMGIPATGNKIEFAAIDVLAWRDGQATDHWAVTDTLAMFTQLGAIEPPG